MGGDALRFAHAGNLRIDVPLCAAGPLPDDARRLAEDAPANAWARIVEACIDRDVAFLLLTPRTAAGALAPIDGRMLLNGLRQLGAHEIPVYWSQATGEALSRTLLDELPDNVSLLTDEVSTATLTRAGRIVATFSRSPAGDTKHPATRLQSGAAAEPPLHIRIAADAGTIAAVPESAGHAAFPVGDSPFAGDYVACWGDPREQRRSVGRDLWIDPGSPCGRSAEEAGCGGINVVEWDGGHIVEIERVPTAAVGWHRCPISVSAETTRADLIERLQLALLELEFAGSEQLWFVGWQIVGTGSEFEQLHDPAVQRELEAAAVSVMGTDGPVQQVLHWELQRCGTSSQDGVSQRLREWLAIHAASECGSLGRDVAVDLHPATVREDAERLLAEWLAPTSG